MRTTQPSRKPARSVTCTRSEPHDTANSKQQHQVSVKICDPESRNLQIPICLLSWSSELSREAFLSLVFLACWFPSVSLPFPSLPVFNCQPYLVAARDRDYRRLAWRIANGLEKICEGCHAAWNPCVFFFVWPWFCRPLFGKGSESLDVQLRVDVDGTEVISSHPRAEQLVHLRATSVPCLKSRAPSTRAYLQHIHRQSFPPWKFLTSSHSHAKEALDHKKLHPPAHAAAPHRTAAISRTRKPMPKRSSIHHHHPHGKSVSTPTFFSTTYDPRILVDIVRTGTLLSLLDSVPVLSRSFSPYISANTVHRHAHYRFFFSRLPGILTTYTSPVSPHHITSRTAFGKKNKRQPAQRASLSAPRVRTVGHLGIFGFWSLTHSFAHRERHPTLAG
jgi:hypothetical protein